jgi:hypothetical protein
MAIRQIFVWQGKDTLKNYGAGIVVVSANDEASAWDRLKRENFHVWYWLQTGIRYVYSPEDATVIDPDDHDPNYPQHPVAYTMDDLPVLIVVGGE